MLIVRSLLAAAACAAVGLGVWFGAGFVSEDVSESKIRERIAVILTDDVFDVYEEEEFLNYLLPALETIRDFVC